MPPEPRRKPRENQFLFDLGVKGRKTGLQVPDTGIRDENGLEQVEHLFSSPDKAAGEQSTKQKRAVNGYGANGNATLESDDMDVGESTIPEPTTVLSERKRASMRMPPRSKSPQKTYLKSPARRNPSLGPRSSPVRGSIVEPRSTSISASVRRRLDFSQSGTDMDEEASSPQKRGTSASHRLGVAKLTNGARLSPFQKTVISDAVSEEDTTNGVEDMEDSYQIANGIEDDDEVAQVEEPEDEPEPEPEPTQQPVKKVRGRPKAAIAGPEPATEEIEAPSKKTRPGRPKRTEVETVLEEERPAKRTRRSLDAPKVAEPAPAKAKKASSSGPAPKPKTTVRKTHLATISESDSPQIQRGPPMPRRPGLLTVRRETPMDGGNAFKQTRSGRTSIKPVAYWKNEIILYEEDEIEDSAGKFLMPRIKEVVRVDEAANQRRQKYRSKSSKPKKRPVESDDEEEVEPWETEPGRLFGEVLDWDPEDPTGAQAEIFEEEIALSSGAILTSDVKDADFKFAKTITRPFFGSGMVDLPPGSMKKTKNSRRMHMAFFVFYGRVKVVVNDNEFRISKGGMWQVPRGNPYSIENDYENPARIFFSQGCEIERDMDETQ